jgi:GNAT superfamily N-acetyltransferase
VMATQNITFEVVKGAQIKSIEQSFANLRISIFREYPYLYQGDLLTEKQYFDMFGDNTICVIAKDGSAIVGIIIGTPLQEVFKRLLEPLTEAPIEKMFYLADILVLKSYRGQQIGHTLYQLFEKEVQKTGLFTNILIREIFKSPDDPKKPSDYYSLDLFWNKKGFKKMEGITQQDQWKAIGDDDLSFHTMIYQEKKI